MNSSKNYIPTDISVLLADGPELKGMLGKEPKYDGLILFLLEVNAIVRKLLSQHPAQEKELHKTLLGIRVYVLKKTESEKSYFEICKDHPLPDFLRGELNFNSHNTMSTQEELIYVGKFYNVIFRNWLNLSINRKAPDLWLAELGFDLLNLQKDCRKIITLVLVNSVDDLKNTFKAPAPQEVYKERIKGLPERYIDLKKNAPLLSMWGSHRDDNPKRLLHTQFAESVGLSIPTYQPVTLDNYINRYEKMERAIGMFLQLSVLLEYHYFRDATNSQLFWEGIRILGCDVRELPIEHVIDCLAALKTILNKNSFLDKVDKFNQKTYREKNEFKSFDFKMEKIRKEIEIIITHLEQNTTFFHRPSIKTLAQLVSLAFLPPLLGLYLVPFWATGAQAGRLFSQSNYTLEWRSKGGEAIRFITAKFGMSGGNFGFLAANFWFDSAFERFWGNVFEAIGLIIGTLTFGTLTVIAELSFKSIREAYRECNVLIAKAREKGMKIQIDDTKLEWMQTIVDLPPEINDEVDKALNMKAQRMQMEKLVQAHHQIGAPQPAF